MILCPKLHSFWCYIYLIASNCSIILPSNERLLVWAFVSSHMSNLQNQNQIGTWQNIYSIYIPIFYKNYYFPEAHNNILINKFNQELLRQLKVDHMIMTTQLAKIKHLDDSPENIEEKKVIPIKSYFLKKWGHPFLCEIDENDSLTINFNPIKLCSHWKKGEAKNKQKAINKEITSLNDQYKSLFDLKREKFQKIARL